MTCVADALAERGFSVELVDADAALDTHCANMFVMCERGAALDRLADAQSAGSVVVNSPSAIRNTYRHRMIELFAQHHVSAPISHVIASDAHGSRPAAAVWVKRYDFHATQPSDVIYVASDAGWHEALERFAQARHSVRRRPGARGGRPRQILRCEKRNVAAGCQLVRVVLSSRQGNAGSFLRGRRVCAMRRSMPRPPSDWRFLAAMLSSRKTGSQ